MVLRKCHNVTFICTFPILFLVFEFFGDESSYLLHYHKLLIFSNSAYINSSIKYVKISTCTNTGTLRFSLLKTPSYIKPINFLNDC